MIQESESGQIQTTQRQRAGQTAMGGGLTLTTDPKAGMSTLRLTEKDVRSLIQNSGMIEITYAIGRSGA